MIMLKDAYIGLIEAASYMTEAPVITSCSVNVIESLTESGYSPVSSALINVMNLDVSPESKTGICSVVIEIAEYSDISLYKNSNNYLPQKWTKLNTIIVANNDGIKGLDNTFTFTINSIPSHPDGLKHKFRLQFLNKDNVPAYFIKDTSVDGSVSGLVFTSTDPLDINADSLCGFSFDLFDTNDGQINTLPVIAAANDATITFCKNSQLSQNKKQSDITYISGVANTYFYALGDDGLGFVFNGIDDFSEIAGVEYVKAEILNGTWIEGNTKCPSLNSNNIRLKFKNMYDHPTTNETLMGDGSVQSVLNSKWKNTENYIVFIRIRNPKIPTSQDAVVLLHPSANDPKAKWYKYVQIDAPKISAKILPEITISLRELPRGAFVSFYVGATSKYTKTSASVQSPPSELNAKFVLKESIGTPLIVGGAAEVEWVLL